MLPYVQLQLLYAAASGLAVLALDLSLGRSERWARRPRVRVGVVGIALALPALAWFAAVKAFDHPHSTWQFSAIAVVFYALALWLPALATVHALRTRAGARRDPALVFASAGAVAVGQLALWIEPNRLVVDTTRVEIASWPAAAEPLRVVHVSDLQTVGACERERRAADAVNALRPDLIVFTGDYVAGPFFDPEPAIAAARAFLAALERPRHGIVCVAGHSENEAIRRRVLEGFDVAYLRNEEIEIALDGARRLRVFGAPAQGADFSRLAPRRESGLATIVVTHEPDVSRELDGRLVDLHFAGHTHGGQVALPCFGPPLTLSALPRRFARGLHAIGDHRLHVNPGIGMEGNHAPRIRFLCPPEVDLVLLAGAGAATGGSGVAELAGR